MNILKSILSLPLFLTALLPTTSCSGGKATADTSATSAESSDSVAQLATTPLHLADSLILGNCRCTVDLTVDYPTEAPAPALASVRNWLASQLMTVYAENSDKTSVPDSVTANGNTLLQMADRSYLAMARTDFEGFDSTFNEYPIQYEFQVNIKPTFVTDRQITYSSTSYIYTAGAHGSTLACGQTFALPDGRMLNAENMFLAESVTEVTDLVKKEIFNQYFKPQIDESEGSATSTMTLADCLLIPINEFALPANPPYFTPDGIAFLYAQYEIAPYAAGMPSCTIPYSTLRPYLTQEAQSLIP